MYTTTTTTTVDWSPNCMTPFLPLETENPECSELLAQWGLELEDAALELEGRVLDKVKIKWGDEQA